MGVTLTIPKLDQEASPPIRQGAKTKLLSREPPRGSKLPNSPHPAWQQHVTPKCALLGQGFRGPCFTFPNPHLAERKCGSAWPLGEQLAGLPRRGSQPIKSTFASKPASSVRHEEINHSTDERLRQGACLRKTEGLRSLSGTPAELASLTQTKWPPGHLPCLTPNTVQASDFSPLHWDGPNTSFSVTHPKQMVLGACI